MIRLVCVVGARPNFIKSASLFRALDRKRRRIKATLIHTGQHYDRQLSEVFFRQLRLPAPDHHLGVGSGTHAEQTAGVMLGCERLLAARRPDWVVVFGDVNSTLGAALAAAKLGIPLAHIEAGLRSYNRAMPEEINRVLTDHLSQQLFCPTAQAVRNLAKEGIHAGVSLVGDIMYDAFRLSAPLARRTSRALKTFNLTPQSYVLATVHRAENTDHPARLGAILSGLADSGEHVVLPLHPRTRRRLTGHPALRRSAQRLHLVPPVSYLDMLALEQSARVIVTDSGGVQKEAYFCGVPCVTVREETEWVETVRAGANRLVGADPKRITSALRRAARSARPVHGHPFGDGRAAERIVRLLLSGTAG